MTLFKKLLRHERSAYGKSLDRLVFGILWLSWSVSIERKGARERPLAHVHGYRGME
jgi:hypothetical protein